MDKIINCGSYKGYKLSLIITKEGFSRYKWIVEDESKQEHVTTKEIISVVISRVGVVNMRRHQLQNMLNDCNQRAYSLQQQLASL